MNHQEGHLLHTSANDSEKLRSLELIVDFASCVRQLVENSIDAKSTEILIQINPSKFFISVSDNGDGISVTEMRDIGNIRYLSSKVTTPGIYGFRGEGIHSISNLSVLEIQSRSRTSSLTGTKIVSRGNTLSTVVDSIKHEPGTTVKIFDLFQDWPVRRQAMKLRLQLTKVKEMLQRLSFLNHHVSFTLTDTQQDKLIWSIRSSVDILSRVCDIRELSVHNHSYHRIDIESDKYRIEGVLSLCFPSHIKPLNEIFVNKMPIPPLNEFSQLLSCIIADTQTVNNRHAGRTCELSLVPSFVLNIHCNIEDCDVYLEPDKSNVFVKDSEIIKFMLLEILYDVSSKQNGESFVKYAQIVANRLDRYSIPLLLPPPPEEQSSQLVQFEPYQEALIENNHRNQSLYHQEETEDGLKVDVLVEPSHELIETAYQDHSSLSNSLNLDDTSPSSPSSTSTPTTIYPCFDSYAFNPLESTHKSKNNLFENSFFDNEPNSSTKKIMKKGSHYLEEEEEGGGKGFKRGVAPKRLTFNCAISERRTHLSGEDLLSGLLTSSLKPSTMVDPDIKNESSRKRSRLSFGDAFFSNSPLLAPTSSFHQTNQLSAASNLQNELVQEEQEDNHSKENEAFSRNEEKAVSRSEDISEDGEMSTKKDEIISRFRAPQSSSSMNCFMNNVDAELSSSTLSSSFLPNLKAKHSNVVTVTKEMLLNAHVIGQVDLKFILARTSQGGLLCIDQHAADERIQLEQLEKDIFQSNNNGFNHLMIHTLKPPKSMMISQTEVSLFELHQNTLLKYGFEFIVIHHHKKLKQTTEMIPNHHDENPLNNNISTVNQFQEYDNENHNINGRKEQINQKINQIQLIIQTVPQILGNKLSFEDMKSILFQINEYDPLSTGMFIKPSVIQYRLCSKACRSAIMFGDKLLYEECCDLILKLSKCDFPFQCAHGRPSTILLMNNLSDMNNIFNHNTSFTSRNNIQNNVKYEKNENKQTNSMRMMNKKVHQIHNKKKDFVSRRKRWQGTSGKLRLNHLAKESPRLGPKV